MNPPKSLMALGAAIVLAAPCVARADDAAGEWRPLKTRPTYFVHLKTDAAEFAKMKKASAHGPLKLWVNEKRNDGTYLKVESDGTLNCGWTQKKKWTCWVDVNSKEGGRYKIAGVDIGADVRAPARPAPADQKPADVSPEVWTAVVRSAKVKPANWARAARDVQAAFRSPKTAKMRAAGAPAMDQLLAGVESGIESGADDSKIVQNAIDLSEKIAGGGVPLVPGAPDAQGKPVDDPSKKTGNGGDQDNTINTLTQELAKPEVQDSLAKRVVTFLTKPDDGAVYVDAKGHEAAATAQLDKGISDGVKKLCATPQDRGRAAVLYFVLGEPGQVPWMNDFRSLTLLGDNSLLVRGFFREAMKRWTKAGAGTPGQADAGPYKGDANWPAQFLKDALDKADQVMKDQRVKDDIAAHIGKFAQNIDVPNGVAVGNGPLMPGSSDLRNLMARAFTADDMYRNGAVVQDVLIPGSKPPKYRTISMKIYSQQTDYGPPPVVEDRLGIFDITDVSRDGGRTPSKIFGQYFPLNQTGESTFLLDDTDPKSIRYKLSISGGGISFVPVNKDGKTPVGDPLETGIGKLYDARNQELADPKQSYMAKLNGQNFRVIPQGGPHGQLVYFPADETGHAIGDTPSLTTDLSKVDPGTGRTQVMRGKQALGYIGKDADGKDQFWWLVWNDKLQVYEARAGDPPPKDQKPYDPMHPPATAGTTPSGSTTTTTTSGTADNTDNTDNTNTDQADPKVKTSDVWACDYKGKFTPAPTFELYRVQQESKDSAKWRLYTEGTAQTDHVNQMYMCVYNTNGIWFEGLIPKKTADGKEPIQLQGGGDGYLRVLVVKPGPAPADGPDKGTLLIKPGDAGNLMVTNDDKLAFGSNQSRDLASNVEYYIPLKGLKANLKKSNGIAVAPKVAWLELSRDFVQGNQNPLLKVYLRPGEDVKKSLTDAVEGYGGDNTVCKSGGNVSSAIAGYIDSVAKDPDLKAELDKADMSNTNYNPPSVMISCLAQQTGANGAWKVAWTSWSLSKNELMTRGGKIDPNSGYAQK